MFRSAFFAKVFSPSPVTASSSLGLLSAADVTTEPTGPFVITGSAPGITIRKIFSNDHLLERSEILLHFESQGLSLYLMLHPAGYFNKLKELPVCDVPRLVFYDGQEASVLCEMNDCMACATFGQVARHPVYQTVLRTFSNASAPQLFSQPAAAVKQGVPVSVVCAIAALVLVSTVLFFSGASSLPAGAQMTAASTAAPPVTTSVMPPVMPVATSLGDQLNEVEKKILSKVVAESGIELTLGGKPFVIFSDPNCPSCRQLEAQLSSMDKSLTPVIVPVSFQRNSAEAVSSILCSANATQAWKIAIAAERGVVPAGGCAKGQAQAEANNAAFTALKFDRTPTIVTSSGKVAVGVKDFDGLAKWIKANS